MNLFTDRFVDRPAFRRRSSSRSTRSTSSCLRRSSRAVGGLARAGSNLRRRPSSASRCCRWASPTSSSSGARGGRDRRDGPGHVRLPLLSVRDHRELCLSPVGLSAMNRLAPSFMASLIMGAWFYMTAVGNFVAGKIGEATGGHDGEMTKQGLLDIYSLFGWISIGAASPCSGVADREALDASRHARGSGDRTRSAPTCGPNIACGRRTPASAVPWPMAGLRRSRSCPDRQICSAAGQ
jgi:hypothetical protein